MVDLKSWNSIPIFNKKSRTYGTSEISDLSESPICEAVGVRGGRPNLDSLTHDLSPQSHVISDSHGLPPL